MKITNYNRTTIYLSILFCGMAMHYMFITILLNDNILFKFWKEIIMMILLIDMMLIKISNRDDYQINISYSSIFIFIFFGFLLIAAIKTKSTSKIIYLFRLYLIPIAIYYIAKNNKMIKKQQFYKMMKVIIVFYTFICLWGIFQAFILGDNFLINLGYPLKYEGRLRDSYYFGGFGDMQRVVSTFSNTNVFAGVIGILLIIISINNEIFESNKQKMISFIILLITFILTFSRANWLSMGCIILILSRKNKKILKSLIKVFILLTILAFIYSAISEVNIIQIIQEYIYKTLTMQDSSAAGRSNIWINALDIFIQHPFGVGLGNVGTVSEKLTGDVIIHGESSYLAILLDLGIQGGICFFGIISYHFIRLVKMNKSNMEVSNFTKTVKCIIIYMSIIFLFSNHIYDLEVTMIVFFFIGLSNNRIFMNSLNKSTT